MRNQTNSSKKALVSSESQPYQYKSEASKVSNVNKSKQKFSVQNVLI
jgi:hypothetical protein